MKDLGSALPKEGAASETTPAGTPSGTVRSEVLRSIEKRYGYVDSEALQRSPLDLRRQLRANLDQLDWLTLRLGFMLREIRGPISRR